MDFRQKLEEMDLASLVALIRNLQELTESDAVHRDHRLSNPVQLILNRAVEELARRGTVAER